MDTWAQNLYQFYASLKPNKKLPNDIRWLFPQQQPEVLDVSRRFFDKYFNDTEPRTLLLGINPGRFGAGVTGVNFTAPKQLTEHCAIEHSFKWGTEISAEFVYAFIEQYGGPAAFYHRFFIGSVCPLGFVQHGKNLNYYDDKELLQAVEPFIIKSLKKLISFGVNRTKCICIGGEKNHRYLKELNARFNWFDEIIPLPHPRFIMQYKRRYLQDYIAMYLEVLKNI